MIGQEWKFNQWKYFILKIRRVDWFWFFNFKSNFLKNWQKWQWMGQSSCTSGTSCDNLHRKKVMVSGFFLFVFAIFFVSVFVLSYFCFRVVSCFCFAVLSFAFCMFWLEMCVCLRDEWFCFRVFFCTHMGSYFFIWISFSLWVFTVCFICELFLFLFCDCLLFLFFGVRFYFCFCLFLDFLFRCVNNFAI